MAFGFPVCSVNVHVKRLGGGYGAKISRSHMVTAACALGAHVTKRWVCHDRPVLINANDIHCWLVL